MKGEDGDATIWYVAAVVSGIIFFIYTISMCLARKRIKTAVVLVKQSTVVLNDRPLTMFFPFGSLIVQVPSSASLECPPVPPSAPQGLCPLPRVAITAHGSRSVPMECH